MLKDWINERERGERGLSPIYEASRLGNLAIIRTLVKYGADYSGASGSNVKRMSVMHSAAIGNQAVSMVYFQGKGLDLDWADTDGCTPLHYAA